jgi:hypothetical protein
MGTLFSGLLIVKSGTAQNCQEMSQSRIAKGPRNWDYE